MSMKKKYIDILLIAVAVLLNACSSGDSGAQPDPTDKPVKKEIQVMTYASQFAETALSRRAAPTGFTAYTLDKTTSMGIYMLLSEPPATDWASPEEKKIIYTNKWHAYFEVTADKTYTVYGYMPKTGDMSSTLAKSTADAATLTIRNIKPITTDDICIITGVEASDEGLKEGNFNWKWPITTSTEDESYKIYILMDHLYAAAQFRLKIDAEYAALRTIKLKTMTLSTNQGSVNATITLKHNTTGESPVSNVDYYTASGSSDAVIIFNNDEGTPLDKETPLIINACFAPTLSENLTLVSTYDVYDSKGNLIRQNCTTTNKLPDLEASRGQRVQVNMLVNPTYLYILSDPDLDNPTITIGN